MIWNKKRIYLDAAAATPISLSAKKELLRLLDVFGNPSALHSEAMQAAQELAKARQRVADALGLAGQGVHLDEVIFTSGGTEGNNIAIMGVLEPLLAKNPGLHAITTSIEHPSILEPLRKLTHSGLRLTELSVNSAGLISLEELKAAVTDSTGFISIQWINSEIGSVQPIREIMKEIRHIRSLRTSNVPLYFHTDASQVPLWKKIHMEKIGVDLMTLDGQKILGPKGVGALYVRRGVQIEGQQLGGGQERGLRSGTENLPLIGSFAVALEEAQKNEEGCTQKIASVRNTLFQEILRLIPTTVLNGAVGDNRVSNNLNISIPSLDGEMAVIALSAEGVAASTRSACDSSDEEPSHVLVALGLEPVLIKSAIRLTLLPSATKKDALFVAKKVKIVYERYKR